MSHKANNALRNHLLGRQGQIMRFVLTNKVHRVLVGAKGGVRVTDVISDDIVQPFFDSFFASMSDDVIGLRREADHEGGPL